MSTQLEKIQAAIEDASHYLKIPEISMAAKVITADHAIRIPIRKLVLYSDRIKLLLASPEMTALAYTRQLGFVHMVYPGAQGTRFEHSLGVYDLACQFVLRMSGSRDFRNVCPETKDALLFILACLLHDIGHFPYAHQVEEFNEFDFQNAELNKVSGLIGKKGGHHKRAESLLKEDNKLTKVLRSAFNLEKDDLERILLIINGGNDDASDGVLKLLGKVLDGPVDLDKLDYIERDANHCGVPYGSYVDVERIFETMRLVNKNGASLIAFDQRGVGPLEQLAVARHQLYANVYWHRAVRAATTMFKHLFYLFQALTIDKEALEKVFYKAGSDDRLLQQIEVELAERSRNSSKNQNITTAKHLVSVLSGKERSLYKAIVQEAHTGKLNELFGVNYIQQRNVAMEIYNHLKSNNFFDEVEAEIFGPHNILIDCRADSWPQFKRIMVISNGSLKSLPTVSPLIQKLGATFKVQACKIRVFINIEILQHKYQSKEGRITVGKSIMSFIRAKSKIKNSHKR